MRTNGGRRPLFCAYIVQIIVIGREKCSITLFLSPIVQNRGLGPLVRPRRRGGGGGRGGVEAFDINFKSPKEKSFEKPVSEIQPDFTRVSVRTDNDKLLNPSIHTP